VDEYHIVINGAQRRLIMRALTNTMANDRRSSVIQRQMNGCSLFGFSARLNRLCEKRRPDFVRLPLLLATQNRSQRTAITGSWRCCPDLALP